MSERSRRYSPEVRERAVRMVLEHQHEYSSQWAAIISIAAKFGPTPETGPPSTAKPPTAWWAAPGPRDLLEVALV
jgi:hypothetical protein